MRPSGLFFFYRQRLRHQGIEELFAGLGIAIAVALLFAVTVASQSISSSAEEVNRALVGPATLQLRARGPEGLGEGMLARVESLQGVQHAAPLLEQTATIVSSSGASTAVNLAGTDISLAVLDGLVHTLPIATLEKGGVGLSKATAEALGIPALRAQSTGRTVSLEIRGLAVPLRVSAVLGPETFGALSQAHVAVMPIERLQSLAGLSHRLTRILVQTTPAEVAHVRSELVGLAAGRLTVASAGQDVSLLREALRPGEQASLFFAAISALLGFLLTFNAVLLTVPERRLAVSRLRLRGVRSTAIVQMVLFQALCLGVAAAVLGLLVGYGLSVEVFAQTPTYLSKSFTLGSSTVVGAARVLVAGIGGIFATCAASLVLLLDLRRGRARHAVFREDGAPGNALDRRTSVGLAVAAVVLVGVRVAANSALPSLALAWCALLAIAAVLCVPLLFAGVLRLSEVVAERSPALMLAVETLKGTTVRSLALVATGAAALFGAVALGGARDDLVRGIGGFAVHYTSEADVWVFTPNDNQAVTAFDAGDREQRIARLPGVRSVTALNGGLLDFGGRRIWILAWPSSSRFSFLDGQILKGNLPTAVERLRRGGWVTVSEQVAAEHHVGVGGTVTLPTPAGETPFRVAALTTNFGWTPGAVALNTADYARSWETTAPTALIASISPGADQAVVQAEISRALSPANGLVVASTQARKAKMNGSVREGLGQLSEISTLLIIASVLAMAAALSSAIWQRRKSLAALKLSGVRPARLRNVVLLESALILTAGAVTGAAWGIYGQVALDSYLTTTTGFPVSRLGASWRPIEILVLVIVASLAISAVPTWFAARVPVRVSLEE
jgi:putative ABC transport system permease protein